MGGEEKPPRAPQPLPGDARLVTAAPRHRARDTEPTPQSHPLRPPGGGRCSRGPGRRVALETHRRKHSAARATRGGSDATTAARAGGNVPSGAGARGGGAGPGRATPGEARPRCTARCGRWAQVSSVSPAQRGRCRSLSRGVCRAASLGGVPPCRCPPRWGSPRAASLGDRVFFQVCWIAGGFTGRSARGLAYGFWRLKGQYHSSRHPCDASEGSDMAFLGDHADKLLNICFAVWVSLCGYTHANCIDFIP